MLVNKTLHGGLEILGGDQYIQGAYGIYTGGDSQVGGTFQVLGTTRLFLSLQVDTTAWIKGDTTIGVPATDLTTLAVRGMINIPVGGFTTGIVMEKALDIDIGANTEFDINDDLFRFSDGTNTLVITASGGINALGQTGIGSSAEAAYKLWVEPDDAQIGIGVQNDQTYGPLEDGWAAAPKVAMRITRDVSKYGLNDYSGIQLYAKPTSPHTAQGIFGVYSDTPANHHTGLFMAAYSGKWMTVFKASYFGDFHLQTEYNRDVDLHFSQMDTNGFPATAISRYIMGFDDGDDSFKIEIGDAFTADPAIEILNDNTVLINGVIIGGTNYLNKYDNGVNSGNDNITPATPIHFIFVDISTLNPSEVIYDYDVDFDTMEASGQAHHVYAIVKMDASGALDCNLRVGFRTTANVDIWTNQVVDGDPAEEWEVEMIWNPGQAEWIVYKNVQTV